jgi:hypothetical protein
MCQSVVWEALAAQPASGTLPPPDTAACQGGVSSFVRPPSRTIAASSRDGRATAELDGWDSSFMGDSSAGSLLD